MYVFVDASRTRCMRAGSTDVRKQLTGFPQQIPGLRLRGGPQYARDLP